jgi:hypothetical protein
MAENLDYIPDQVVSLDRKTALIITNPIFWLISNALQIGIMTLAQPTMSELSPQQLHTIFLGCHLANFLAQNASLQLFGLSGNYVANALQSDNRYLNFGASVLGYSSEAIGRNLMSPGNWLSHSIVDAGSESLGIATAVQAIAGLITTGLVFGFVATGSYEPVAIGVQKVRSSIRNFARRTIASVSHKQESNVEPDVDDAYDEAMEDVSIKLEVNPN